MTAPSKSQPEKGPEPTTPENPSPEEAPSFPEPNGDPNRNSGRR
jgi:hypothetical protein